MNELTYEKTPEGHLETYEWDNVWWEKTKSTDKGRIMYVGDSISFGTRNAWNNTEGIEWYLDNCATSKAVDNPYLLPMVKMFGHQQKSCDAILVNNGLHGWHLRTHEYADAYERFLSELKKEFPERKMFVITTTCVTDDPIRNSVVKERNATAKALAEKLKMPVIDLYPLSETLEHTDGVHLKPEGYAALTEKIRAALKEYLK